MPPENKLPCPLCKGDLRKRAVGRDGKSLCYFCHHDVTHLIDVVIKVKERKSTDGTGKGKR